MSGSETETSDEEYESQNEKTTDKREFICEYCKKKYKTKGTLVKHIKQCQHNRNKLNRCMWCGLAFHNRGVLAVHASRIHGDTSYQMITKETYTFKCDACEMNFHSKITLKYHIRKSHFNLRAPIPSAEVKKVNQVWFEKALNNTRIVEMKKTGPSKLIIRSLNDNTNIKLNDITPEMLDLSDVYPVNRGRIECTVCHKIISKKDYKKHYSEKHLNLKTHHCNNCNRMFKRTYLYLKHFCNKTAKLRGVKHTKQDQSSLRIASVESMGMPLG